MNTESQYYRVGRQGDDIPLLDPDEGCPVYFSKKAPIENPELMLFQLGDPVPKKPRMADYHSSPDSVISKKIFDVLNPLQIEGIQLLPAQIRGKDDQIFDKYWGIHIYNRLQCVDAELSDCVIKSIRLSNVKKIVLDTKVLDAIPLEKRLIFRLKEDSSFQLFHSSVVDAILAVNPEGIRFVELEKWHDGSFFEN